MPPSGPLTPNLTSSGLARAVPSTTVGMTRAMTRGRQFLHVADGDARQKRRTSRHRSDRFVAVLVPLVASIIAPPGRWPSNAVRASGRMRSSPRMGAGGMGEVYRARDERLDRSSRSSFSRRT